MRVRVLRSVDHRDLAELERYYEARIEALERELRRAKDHLVVQNINALNRLESERNQ